MTPPGNQVQNWVCALTGNNTMASWFIGAHSITDPHWLDNTFLFYKMIKVNVFFFMAKLKVGNAILKFIVYNPSQQTMDLEG